MRLDDYSSVPRFLKALRKADAKELENSLDEATQKKIVEFIHRIDFENKVNELIKVRQILQHLPIKKVDTLRSMILSLPPKDLATVTFSLLKDDYDESHRCFILGMVQNIPEKLRNEKTIGAVVAFHQGVEKLENIYWHLVEDGFSIERYIDAVSALQPVVKNINDWYHRNFILYLLLLVPDSLEKKNVLSSIIGSASNFTPKKEDDDYHETYYEILRALHSIPIKDRAEIINYSLPFLEHVAKRDIRELIDYIGGLPSLERKVFSDYLQYRLINSDPSKIKILKFWKEYKKIPAPLQNAEAWSTMECLKRDAPKEGYPSDSNALLQALFTGFDDEDERMALAMTIQKTPPENRLQMMQAAVEFKRKIKDNLKLVDIMEILSTFPPMMFDEKLRIFKSNNNL